MISPNEQVQLLRSLIDRELSLSRAATLSSDHLTDPRAVRAMRVAASSAWHCAEVLRHEAEAPLPSDGDWRARFVETALAWTARIDDGLALRWLHRILARQTTRLKKALELLSGPRRDVVLQLVFPAHVESHVAVRQALERRTDERAMASSGSA